MLAPGTLMPAGSGIRSPFTQAGQIHAVLFDLDGTLYQQRALRALMAVELTTAVFGGLKQASRTWRGVAAYRQAQELLRPERAHETGWQGEQLDLAARNSGLPRQDLERIVAEWMFERPLKYLRVCRAPGLLELMTFLEGRGLKMGVLSDYPAAAKLVALGVADRFSLVLCSTDREIGAFKPSPRGFLKAAEFWHLDPRDVLMVGDRHESDAAGAAAAGMPCAIIGRTPTTRSATAHCLVFSSLKRLHRALDNSR